MVHASPARRPSRLEPIATTAPLGDDGSGSFTPRAVVTGVPPFTGTAITWMSTMPPVLALP